MGTKDWGQRMRIARKHVIATVSPRGAKSRLLIVLTGIFAVASLLFGAFPAQAATGVNVGHLCLIGGTPDNNCIVDPGAGNIAYIGGIGVPNFYFNQEGTVTGVGSCHSPTDAPFNNTGWDQDFCGLPYGQYRINGGVDCLGIKGNSSEGYDVVDVSCAATQDQEWVLVNNVQLLSVGGTNDLGGHNDAQLYTPDSSTDINLYAAKDPVQSGSNDQFSCSGGCP
jgi:hypothetical protein